LRSILSDFEISSIDDKLFDMIAQKSCKAAIKAHDKLTSVQITNLLDEMFSDVSMLTCPHGRPYFIEITKSEIEKRFKRS
jgi:DNA mismatch repair protein MutL